MDVFAEWAKNEAMSLKNQKWLKHRDYSETSSRTKRSAFGFAQHLSPSVHTII